MKNLLELIQREDGAYSLLRILALVFSVNLLVMTYLEFFCGKIFAHYSEFAAFTGTVVALAVGNKVAEIRSSMALGNKQQTATKGVGV